MDSRIERNKQMKAEIPDAIDAEMKIADVIDDCLVHIFKYLTLQDLINIADTCKRFQPPSKLAFAAKWRGKKISLKTHGVNDEKVIQITNFTRGLKVLRHFGSMIGKLSVDYYYRNAGQKVEVARYMNEYCADSLIDIEIKFATKQMVANWTKPFANVESIQLCLSELGDLTAWFPKMRRLTLSYSHYPCIVNTYLNLEELEIKNYGSKNMKQITPRILRLNPHLQKLHLESIFDMEFLKTVSEYLQSLRYLYIRCHKKCLNLEGTTIHFTMVNELYIHLDVSEPMPKIPMSFDQLEQMQVKVEKFDLNDDFRNFITQNPSLTKLTIFVRESLYDTHSIQQIKTKLAKVSPQLDVDLIGCPIHDFFK